MKIVVLVLLAVALGGWATAQAQPSAVMSSCSLDARGRLLLIPDGLGDVTAASFTVTVRDAMGIPIVGSLVTVDVGGQVEGMTRICSGQLLTDATGPGGIAAFNIGGGGCYKGPTAVRIVADSVPLRSYGAVMSPDYTGTDNAGLAGRASLTVDPLDLAAFVAAYQGGVGPASCHDYNNDGWVGVADLAVFGAGYKGGVNFCR